MADKSWLVQLEARIVELEKDSHPEVPVIPALEVTKMMTGLNEEILALRRRVLELEQKV